MRAGPQAQNQPCSQGPIQVLGSSDPGEHQAETMLGTVLEMDFRGAKKTGAFLMTIVLLCSLHVEPSTTVGLRRSFWGTNWRKLRGGDQDAKRSGAQ